MVRVGDFFVGKSGRIQVGNGGVEKTIGFTKDRYVRVRKRRFLCQKLWMCDIMEIENREYDVLRFLLCERST